jgi:hypothetical protein
MTRGMCAVRVRSGECTVALLLMEVRIGTTWNGRSVGFDTISRQPLLLVGDDGRGKSTTARYLVRWWLADTLRHAHLLARWPSEWADLRRHTEHPSSAPVRPGRACRPVSCLVVVDDADLMPDDQLALLPVRSACTILTSHGAALAERPLFDDGTCLGLVRSDPVDPGEAAVLKGQGRLDWPVGTVPVVPDARGPMDFPRHRWQAAADWANEWAADWSGVAR